MCIPRTPMSILCAGGTNPTESEVAPLTRAGDVHRAHGAGGPLAAVGARRETVC